MNFELCKPWIEQQKCEIHNDSQKFMYLLQFVISTLKCFYRGIPFTENPRNANPPLKRQNPHIIPMYDMRFEDFGHWPVNKDGHKRRCRLETCGDEFN